MKYTIAFVSALLFFPGLLSAQVKRPLMKDSREELAKIMAYDYKVISLAIATFEGKTDVVVKETRRLGGQVRYRSDELGYLRVNVPVERAAELVAFPHVQAAMINTAYYGEKALNNSIKPIIPVQKTIQDTFTERQIDTTETPWPPVLSDYPFEHPYHPWEDLDVTDFIKENPTFDGRGVVIGQIESFVDVALPELQWALDINGNKVRKVIDQINVTDPLDAELIVEADLKSQKTYARDLRWYKRDPRWVDMNEEVIANEGQFIFNDSTYHVSEDGTHRVGLLILNQGLKNILKRIKAETNTKNKVAVLWNESSRKVWVDTNSDRDFTDEKGLKEYKIGLEYGFFGEDDPSTAIRESVPFTVQIDKKNKFISINDGRYEHATMVAGSAVANDTFEGKIKGVAPNAQLIVISYSYGSIKSYYLEALILAFMDERIDMVLIESFSPQSTGIYDLRDGTSVIGIIQERLFTKYPKPVVVTGGNTLGLGQIGNDTVVESIFCIGGYQSNDAVLTNRAIEGAPRDDIHFASAYGPAGNGRLKPDFLSPSFVISLFPGFTESKGTLKYLYDLPPGYTLGGGTSQATPVAAGSIALLVSALKQNDMDVNPKYLKKALISTARYLPDLQAHQQGNGLIQVGEAWELLKEFENREVLIEIESEADVKTVNSHLLATPHRGAGLFEQEGWKKGMAGERTILLTRTTGPDEPLPFDVSWQGNDGTFSGRQQVVLPLNKPVPYPVQITISDYGAHSALLILDNPDYPGQEGKVMTTIVVPDVFNEANNFQIEKKEMLFRPNGQLDYFIHVPEGTEHLSVEIKSSNRDLLLYLHPPDKSFAYPSWTAIYGDSNFKRINFSNPIPGNWEVVIKEFPIYGYSDFIENLGEPLPEVSVTTTLNLYKTSIKGGPAHFSIDNSGNAAETLTFVNELSAFKGRVTGAEVGAERRVIKSIEEKEQHFYEVKIDSGTTALLFDLNINGDSNADLDLILLDPNGRNVFSGQFYANYESSGFGRSHSGREYFTIDNPMPGKWEIIVDGFLIPEDKVEYTYSDIIQHPKYGSVSTSDSFQWHESGDEWTVNTHLWLNEKPKAGREPVGVLRLERLTPDVKKEPVLLKRWVIPLEK